MLYAGRRGFSLGLSQYTGAQAGVRADIDAISYFCILISYLFLLQRKHPRFALHNKPNLLLPAGFGVHVDQEGLPLRVAGPEAEA